MSIRAASDPTLKQFYASRADTLRVLLKNFYVDDEPGARTCEAEIYRRGHTNLDTYLLTAVYVVRRLRKHQDPWAEREATTATTAAAQPGSRVSQQELRSMFEVNLSDVIQREARFALAQCSKCKSQEIYSEQVQIRSADEGMSIRNTCQRCGYKWLQR